MAIRLVDIVGFTSCGGFTLTSLSERKWSSSPIYTEGTNIKNLPNGNVVNSTNLRIVKNGRWLTAYNGSNVNLGDCDCDGMNWYGLAFAVDDSTQKGSFVVCYQVQPNYFIQATSFSDFDNNPIYQAIIGSEVPAYNWQSVPSISGKNGILSLAQIKEEYIEGGEPTSSAEATCFDNLLRANKVATLIEASLPEPEIGGTTVTVSYLIEATLSGSYTYCKLVAKRNKIPNDVTDGDKIIDLDPTKTSVTIKNLRGLTKYYFVIFVKDSNNLEASSEPKSITTGEANDVVLFTDEFNEDILVDNWDIAVYKSGWGNSNSNWNPSQFAPDFLTAYNFLIGNSSKRTIYLGDGEITADQKTSMTDATFWIPINRSIVPEAFKIEFDAKVSPLGSSDYSYNYTWVAVGCVDSDNNWHQSAYEGGIPGQDWIHYELEVTNWTYGYIDYIGLSDCDGKPHWKNIKVTVG